MSEVGADCPYCPGCHLQLFRINCDEWIVKCESDKCMYPLAVSLEQSSTWREQEQLKDEEVALGDFLGEALNGINSEPASDFSETDFVELKPFDHQSALPLESTSSLNYFLEQVQFPLELLEDTFDTSSQSTESQITTTQIITIPPVQIVERKHENPNQSLKLRAEERKPKIKTSIKLKSTGNSGNSSSSASIPKKIKSGQIIRRIIKREPRGGSEHVKEVVQKVTHMKPLDYVNYFMDQNRKR